jgi:predicted small secreted protein
MSNLRAIVVVVCAGVLTACATGQSAEQDFSHADIAHVANVKSSFGPDFKVNSVAPTGIDPRLLGPQTLPPGMTFDPADCGKAASQQIVPAGVKGNMAATTAEGEGERFIAIAVETSEVVPRSDPAQNCQKVAFTGPGMRGLVEVVEAPQIGGVHTLGTHRVLQTTVDGKPRTGELYNYVASFGTFLVIVTANPLVLPDKPVAPVNTQRARDLLTAAVAAVKG